MDGIESSPPKRRIVRWLTISALVWLVGDVWLTSDGGLSMPDAILLGYSWLGLSLAWFVFLVTARMRGSPIPLRHAAVSLTGLVIGFSLFWSGDAVYVRFLASRTELHSYVLRARRDGIQSTVPIRVGLFDVRETETLKDGTVRLITASCGWDDCGLAFHESMSPPGIGEDFYERMSGGWWRWARSW